MSNVVVTYDIYEAKSYEDALKIMTKRGDDVLTHEPSLQITHHVSPKIQKLPPECLVPREFTEKLAETVLLTVIPISLAEDSPPEVLEEGVAHGNHNERTKTHRI